MNATDWWGTLDSIGFGTARLLLSVLWQSSIPLAAAGLLAFVLRRRRASVRHTLWVAALVLTPLLPLVALGASRIGTPQAPIPVMPAYAPLPPVLDVLPAAPAAPEAPNVVALEAPAPPPRFSPADYPWALALLASAPEWGPEWGLR